MIANFGSDERGKLTGGKAGDQTGGEGSIRSWYNRPWNVILRHPDPVVRKEIALVARKAALNNNIGYDQSQRSTFWEELKKIEDYDPSRIMTPCETDCSACTSAVVKAVGYRLGIQKLKEINQSSTTRSMRTNFRYAGFQELTESKYLTSDTHLVEGDVLLLEGGHAAINLSVGDNAEDYVPSVGGTTRPEGTSTSDIVTDEFQYYMPYNPSSVHPIRALNIIENYTTYAYFKIFFGADESNGAFEFRYDTGKPNMYQHFEINRLDEAGCTAQLTIFDDNWWAIEYYLANDQYWRNIYLQYGYTNGVKSPKYKMLLSDYTIDFYETGVMLSIRAISESIWRNADETISLDTETKNPGEAIKKICIDRGWEVIDENFVETRTVEDRYENYILAGDSPISYIREVILPECRTDDDETFEFYIDANDAMTAHLVVKAFGKNRNNTKTSETDIRTYLYRRGYDSTVKSLTFNTKGIFGGTANFDLYTSMASSVLDEYDNSEHYKEKKYESVITGSTGNYTHTHSLDTPYLYKAAGESPGQLDNKLHYFVKNRTHEQYEATMVILGDPSIQLFEDVRIMHIMDNGEWHHTTGIYMVKGIVDSVQNGVYLTTLKLIRNGNVNDGTDGTVKAEIVNTKTLVR